MFLSAHIVAGLIIGKVTNNYPLAIASSILIDLDHLIPYIKHGVVLDLKKFWKTIINPIDLYGKSRNCTHSLFTWAVTSGIIFLIDINAGIIVSVSYLGHLLLDALDNSDLNPFYPLKYNVIGPIGYFSSSEVIFTLLLFIVFLII